MVSLLLAFSLYASLYSMVCGFQFIVDFVSDVTNIFLRFLLRTFFLLIRSLYGSQNSPMKFKIKSHPCSAIKTCLSLFKNYSHVILMLVVNVSPNNTRKCVTQHALLVLESWQYIKSKSSGQLYPPSCQVL